MESDKIHLPPHIPIPPNDLSALFLIASNLPHEIFYGILDFFESNIGKDVACLLIGLYPYSEYDKESFINLERFAEEIKRRTNFAHRENVKSS